jgi:hypothetical protein
MLKTYYFSPFLENILASYSQGFSILGKTKKNNFYPFKIFSESSSHGKVMDFIFWFYIERLEVLEKNINSNTQASQRRF